MEIALVLLLGVGVGVAWVVVLGRRRPRQRPMSAPTDVSKVLEAYRKGRWQQVADGAPEILARPSDGGDTAWRPALELALGQALVETDHPADAVPHLERGLLLQSAVRRAPGGSTVPESADAKFRHLLGWSYAATGRTAQARREYRRVLDIPGLDPDVRTRVEASLDGLR